MAQTQIQIIERSRGNMVYKEVQEGMVGLIYNEMVIELRGDVLRAFRKWSPEETEDLVVAVKLKPRTAAKLRKYMLRVNRAIEIAVFWFELERATIFMTPQGADVKFWKLDLDEPDKPRQKKPFMRILSRLKPRLFS
jgi:hypothetical protein